MISTVIVTYYADAKTFRELLERLAHQVDKFFIVDNTPSEEDTITGLVETSGVELSRVEILLQGENLGIGRALNIGIDAAITGGAEYILLSDQDSYPSSEMVVGLVSAFKELLSKGERVGAVGPSFTDIYTQTTYPFQVKLAGKLLYGHRAPESKDHHIETLSLITSGMLVRSDTYAETGLMNSDFFIDQVDLEWCHRARSVGYKIYGTGRSTMEQRMGEHRLRVWYFGWRNESRYEPQRIYYRVRNFVSMCKMDYIDLSWKLRASWYTLGVVYSHVVFASSPVSYIKAAIMGFWDGVKGRAGERLV